MIHADEERPGKEINAADDEIPPIKFEEAVEFLKRKVPITKAEWKSVEPKARFRAFTVAKLGSATLIDTVKQQLLEVLEDGKGYAEFWNRIKQTVENDVSKIKPGYWETVFRTNTQSAYVAGKLQQFENSGVAAYQLMVIEDVRTSQICRNLLNKNSGYGIILPVAHPFWQKYGFPPYHFNCRSSIRGVWPSQVGKIGNVVTNPGIKSIQLRDFKPQGDFGGNPLVEGSWWELTAGQMEQAKDLGIVDELSYKEKLIQQITDKIKEINEKREKMEQDVLNYFKKQSFYEKHADYLTKKVKNLTTTQLQLFKDHLTTTPIKYNINLRTSVYTSTYMELRSINDLYHEFGHRLDDFLLENIQIRSYMVDLAETLKQDALTWINSQVQEPIKDFVKIPKYIKEKINQILKVSANNKKYMNVSDVLDPLTGGKLGGIDNCGVGHKKSYYKNKVAMHLEGEAIAHAVDAWYNPKKSSSEGFKEVFPTFYENLINLFEETVNAR
ncbi:MAG: minor capsid protein [Paludibacteraceae bacterium]|nr:minor capsid protein [Paludibacteraceae bacterium]